MYLSKIETINKELNAIDITSIAKYSSKVEKLATMNKMMASHFMADFLMAFNIASNMYSQVIQLDLNAKSYLDTQESIAYLDKAKAYLDSKGIKESSEARKQYINVDADVIAARETRARTEALVCFFKNKVVEFKSALEVTKKIAYGDTDNSNGIY